MDYIIRAERASEYREVETLVREAFWNVYRPGCMEHYLLKCMRSHPDFIPQLDFVMEKDGRLIGQNVFVKAHVTLDAGGELPVLMMGPICVANDLKRRGWGKKLLDYTMEKAAEAGYCAILIEGNYDFYSKCGFVHAREFGVRCAGLPEGADDSFFLARELIPGYLSDANGVFSDPECYIVDEKECEEFDKQFPPMVKLKLPGQLV